MKKTSLLFALLFLAGIASAQFTVEDYNGVPILDGDVRGVNTTDPAIATLYFWINNESTTDDILIKIKQESITNSDGSSYQFCFGMLCIFDVQEGQVYPADGIPIMIPAGGTNPQYDKFQTENEGDGTNYPIDYVWKFFQVDEDDNEIGESITFTYRYDPLLSVNDLEAANLGVILHNTIAARTLRVESINTLMFEIFNLNGQMINTDHISSGISDINTSNLNAGVYFIRFTDGSNNTSTMKFVVK